MRDYLMNYWDHAWDAAGKTDFRKVTDKKTGRYITKMYEIKAIYVENKARSLSGRKIRRTRGNRELPLLILKNPFEN